MRVLFVGATSPPGGESARRFAVAAGERSALGDTVEVHAPGRLSVAHVALPSRRGAMVRDLKENRGRFDAVALRIEADRPVRLASAAAPRRRALARLLRAVDGYLEVTLMLDPGSPLLRALTDDAVRHLFDRATYIVVAAESERAEIATFDHEQGTKCSVVPVRSPRSVALRDSVQEAPSLVWADVQGEIRHRSLEGLSQRGLLVDPPGRARPSLAGSSVWLFRRVIGKTRGAVTKLLRP